MSAPIPSQKKDPEISYTRNENNNDIAPAGGGRVKFSPRVKQNSNNFDRLVDVSKSTISRIRTISNESQLVSKHQLMKLPSVFSQHRRASELSESQFGRLNSQTSPSNSHCANLVSYDFSTCNSMASVVDRSDPIRFFIDGDLDTARNYKSTFMELPGYSRRSIMNREWSQSSLISDSDRYSRYPVSSLPMPSESVRRMRTDHDSTSESITWSPEKNSELKNKRYHSNSAEDRSITTGRLAFNVPAIPKLPPPEDDKNMIMVQFTSLTEDTSNEISSLTNLPSPREQMRNLFSRDLYGGHSLKLSKGHSNESVRQQKIEHFNDYNGGIFEVEADTFRYRAFSETSDQAFDPNVLSPRSRRLQINYFGSARTKRLGMGSADSNTSTVLRIPSSQSYDASVGCRYNLCIPPTDVPIKDVTHESKRERSASASPLCGTLGSQHSSSLQQSKLMHFVAPPLTKDEKETNKGKKQNKIEEKRQFEEEEPETILKENFKELKPKEKPQRQKRRRKKHRQQFTLFEALMETLVRLKEYLGTVAKNVLSCLEREGKEYHLFTTTPPELPTITSHLVESGRQLVDTIKKANYQHIIDEIKEADYKDLAQNASFFALHPINSVRQFYLGQRKPYRVGLSPTIVDPCDLHRYYLANGMIRCGLETPEVQSLFNRKLVKFVIYCSHPSTESECSLSPFLRRTLYFDQTTYYRYIDHRHQRVFKAFNRNLESQLEFKFYSLLMEVSKPRCAMSQPLLSVTQPKNIVSTLSASLKRQSVGATEWAKMKLEELAASDKKLIRKIGEKTEKEKAEERSKLGIIPGEDILDVLTPAHQDLQKLMSLTQSYDFYFRCKRHDWIQERYLPSVVHTALDDNIANITTRITMPFNNDSESPDLDLSDRSNINVTSDSHANCDFSNIRDNDLDSFPGYSEIDPPPSAASSSSSTEPVSNPQQNSSSFLHHVLSPSQPNNAANTSNESKAEQVETEDSGNDLFLQFLELDDPLPSFHCPSILEIRLGSSFPGKYKGEIGWTQRQLLGQVSDDVKCNTLLNYYSLLNGLLKNVGWQQTFLILENLSLCHLSSEFDPSLLLSSDIPKLIFSWESQLRSKCSPSSKSLGYRICFAQLHKQGEVDHVIECINEEEGANLQPEQTEEFIRNALQRCKNLQSIANILNQFEYWLEVQESFLLYETVLQLVWESNIETITNESILDDHSASCQNNQNHGYETRDLCNENTISMKCSNPIVCWKNFGRVWSPSQSSPTTPIDSLPSSTTLLSPIHPTNTIDDNYETGASESRTIKRGISVNALHDPDTETYCVSVPTANASVLSGLQNLQKLIDSLLPTHVIDKTQVDSTRVFESTA